MNGKGAVHFRHRYCQIRKIRMLNLNLESYMLLDTYSHKNGTFKRRETCHRAELSDRLSSCNNCMHSLAIFFTNWSDFT